MRVHVYGDNLVNREAELERKTIKGEHGSPDVDYYGIRIFVEEKRMHGTGDDDTACITFWYCSQLQRSYLLKNLRTALKLIEQNEGVP